MNSSLHVVWRCNCCKEEFEAIVSNRTKHKSSRSYCKGKQPKWGINDLLYTYSVKHRPIGDGYSAYRKMDWENLDIICLHKHAWKLIDSLDGANTSTVIYSIMETAKANELNPFKYQEHVLTVLKNLVSNQLDNMLNTTY